MSPNVVKALRTWRSLVALLPFLSEDEVHEALDVERAGRKRKSVLERLVKRATRISATDASSYYKEFLNVDRRTGSASQGSDG